MKKRVISLIVLSIAILAVFIIPVLGITPVTYVSLAAVLVSLTVLIVKINKELFPAILFFTLVHVSRPLNEWFTGFIGINFPGTYFLTPILVFTILILTIAKIRKTISWWTPDRIDRSSALIIIGLSIISAVTLFFWGERNAAYLQSFTDQIPDVPFVLIVFCGIGFALFNSIAEEYLARGMLCNGLEKIFSDKRIIIIIQAVIFGIFHYHGFPGRLTGVVMVFVWSLVLGIIRYRTKGLIGVLTGHFLADFTIYFTLYGLK
jgi:uncharacterized protein